MKKYIQLLVVFILVLTVIGIGRNGPAWASSLLAAGQPSGAAQPPSEITITESGNYSVGGLCEFNAVYTGSGASAKVAVDVLTKDSLEVPFPYEGELYLAGCHLVHYTMGEVTREMSAAYGSWEVCFGDRPDEQLTIYYYLDDPESGSAVWLPLVTTVANGFVCAPANYTGVYAPGGSSLKADAETEKGSVQPPPSTVTITQSGTYAVGGVCSIIIEYNDPKLSNVVKVEDAEISAKVPFPDNEGLLYLPGCHLFHYRAGALVTEVTPDDGSWKICFASIPNKETTIYFYSANDDIGPVTSVWTPLGTTIENGMACTSLAYHTGVYAPAGK